MRVTQTELPEVLLLEPKVFRDERGFFLESWTQRCFEELGLPTTFVQDNLSRSGPGVLRGLHLQNPHAQGKLIQVFEGEVFDVAVDVRRGSPRFGRWIGFQLSAENLRQVYIPPGFAHGFCVVGSPALVSYKCTDVFHPQGELTVLWNDPDIGIEWPVEDPVVSAKDGEGQLLAQVDPDRLPRMEICEA